LATEGREPVRIFAKHFWTEEIVQTLKRAREAHAQCRDDLNNLKMTLRFGSKDEHSDDLLVWMASVIALHGDEYAGLKHGLGRSVGYEESAFHGNVRFNIADLGALVDHQIGLAPVAPPLNITMRERRFGIDSLQPLFQGVPSVLQMQSHPQPCRVRVRGANDDVWLDGKLFVPALPNLPIEFRKLRVVADFLEIVMTGINTGNVTFHLNPGDHRSLPELRALASVMKIADEGPIQIQIARDGSVLPSFSVNFPTEKSDANIEISSVIACLEKVSIGILPPDLTLSLLEIRRAWNAIVAFNGLVAGTDMKGNFTLSRDIPTEVGQATSIFLYDYVDIGDWTFMAVARRQILKLEIDGAEALFECGAPRVVEALVRRGQGKDYLVDLCDLYARARGLEGDGVLELNEGDYRSLAIGAPQDIAGLPPTGGE
jgi:hypothetical protein